MGQYKILSLDGGGVQGLVTVRLLEKLTQVPGLENVFDSVDLIAGNSSGGLIALAMARARAAKIPMRVALAEIRAVFENGANVFGPRRRFLGFWVFSKYFNDHKQTQLEKSLKQTKLSDLGTHVLITTFDLDNEGTSEEQKRTTQRWKPKIFHNFQRADGRESQDAKRGSDRDQLARDVALYTTAAPSYFPTADGYIDGGVYANNPSMCALAQVLDARYEPLRKPPLDEIAMLSVGAGRNATYVKGMNERWGVAPWAGATYWLRRWGLPMAQNYVKLTMDATVGTADYQSRQILGEDNYHRVDVDFEKGVAFDLDDVERLTTIRAIVNDVDLEPHIEWLKRNWTSKPTTVAPARDVTSKHILGTTELACLMPIKSGFADAFETHTYATRARIVLRTLHKLRQASREVSAVRVFPDLVDVIRSIQSFRLSFLPGNQLLLNVTFDRPWEPYIRLVWRDLGPLIDLILINCDGYEEQASDKGFDRFAKWVRDHQVEAELFYSASPCTVDDVAYLTKLERCVRDNGKTPGFDEDLLRLRVESPESITARLAREHADEMVRQGLIVLAAVYRLREVYRDGTPDAQYLRAAVAATFKLFNVKTIPDDQRTEYTDEVKWLEGILQERSVDDVPRADVERREADVDQIQGGVITHYTGVAHGCLLLARIDDVHHAQKFLRDTLLPCISRQSDSQRKEKTRNGVYTNVAFTFQGLKRLGVTDADLAAFPKEFQEGMETRAGLLGDVRGNHPDNWELPAWNWPDPAAGGFDRVVERVRLSTIDFVIELEDAHAEPPDTVEHQWVPDHPLYAAARNLVGDPAETGVRVMSVQPMVLHRDKRGTEKPVVVEHFGFRDGISQPEHGPSDKKAWSNNVKLGELVLGYENDRDDPPFFDKNDSRALPGRTRNALLDNGTFLVVRKLEQNVKALYEAIDKLRKGRPELSREDILAKLMGRDLKGTPVTTPAGGPGHNSFTYKDDDGLKCPLHAHIRRGNPRTKDVPRIVRRAMSYGPRYRENALDDAKRGMMFLAYNASIAEQFEVIQRWMTGGNSTDGYSERRDPFLRVPQKGREDTFLIPHNGHVLRFKPGDEAFVTLKWGMYLFVPSIAAIEAISAIDHPAAAPLPDEQTAAVQIAIGAQVIGTLKTDDDWTVILEDSTANSSGRTAAVCAAIRHLHDGVFRTPGGSMVLIASEPLAMRVLQDDRLFSVSEYRNRMRKSIGEIYLGMDSHHEEYGRLSKLPNEAIGEVTESKAFSEAYERTTALLNERLAEAVEQPLRLSFLDVADQVVAELSQCWFGLPNDKVILKGGRPADGGTDPLRCPFHFIAPSRYIFSSPRPRRVVRTTGQVYGQALRDAVARWARYNAGSSEWPEQLPEIAQACWKASCNNTSTGDPDLFARMLVGVMEGMVPTVYGNFLRIMNAWTSDKEETLWRVQQDLLFRQEVDPYGQAESAVKPRVLRAMQARPVPDILYRTATAPTRLGDVNVEEGDRVVVLTGSAMQDLAARGKVTDVYPMFGGNRKSANDHPTHACPGYEMGLGAIIGMVTAVLNAGTFAPTPTPFVVHLSRPAPYVYV